MASVLSFSILPAPAQTGQICLSVKGTGPPVRYLFADFFPMGSYIQLSQSVYLVTPKLSRHGTVRPVVASIACTPSSNVFFNEDVITSEKGFVAISKTFH